MFPSVLEWKLDKNQLKKSSAALNIQIFNWANLNIFQIPDLNAQILNWTKLSFFQISYIKLN
jgi:hypothetical protein